MGHTLLSVLGFLSLNILLHCGHAQDAVLTIEPNWSTLFIGESVTFICDMREREDTDWWYSIRRDGHAFFQYDLDKRYTLTFHYTGHSGEFQCFGSLKSHPHFKRESNKVSLTVSDKDVILQTPASTLFEGESVTLRCRHRDQIKKKNAAFYKDGSPIEIDPNHQSPMISNNTVQLISDGSSYTCKFDEDEESDPIKLRMEQKPQPVLTVSPLWLSPGDSVTLNCNVTDPSAGWRFYWYKAVPKPAGYYYYSYELLPGSTNGTEQDSYIVHGQTHTAGYVCRAGRGDPVFHSDYSEPKFVWSGDFHSAASLTVSPDRVQHFDKQSVSLTCEGNSTKWRVMRLSEYGSLIDCTTWGTMTGSTCNIDRSWLSGVYWCESETGQFSNAVNITIPYEDIILVSPVHPVAEGHPVTLGCKLNTEKVLHDVDFYKNDKLIKNHTNGELIITAVSKSDEGFYRCKGKESPPGSRSWTSQESWMSVKYVPASEPEKSSPFPVLFIVGLVCGVLLIILLLLFLYGYRKSKDSCFKRITQSQRTNQDSAPDRVVNQNETQPQLQSSYIHDADESSDVTYSLIQFKNIRKKGQRNEPEVSCVYSDVKQLQKNHILQ
ncbi:Fc receptor-like protein 5 isoform X3 [Sebastes fasciatus]|uniref:Fc receptor-like protein 5 isoform X3 n=1 Tax=Sebastes fasciatus TaxID=394691 RepID=UPI003D9F662F